MKRIIMLREESEITSRNSKLSDIEIDKDLIIQAPIDKDIIELYYMEEKDNETNEN